MFIEMRRDVEAAGLRCWVSPRPSCLKGRHHMHNLMLVMGNLCVSVGNKDVMAGTHRIHHSQINCPHPRHHLTSAAATKHS